MIKKTISIDNRVTVKYNTKKQKYYHIQIGNKSLYECLLSIGLTPNKSLTLGALAVPDSYFADFLRGVIDGDGCIRSWAHPSNKREQWSLRIYSGSREFVDWLKNVAGERLKVSGKIHKNTSSTLALKYGKMAAKVILEQCYYKNCLGLDRKIKLAKECVGSYKGWSISKTMLN